MFWDKKFTNTQYIYHYIKKVIFLGYAKISIIFWGMPDMLGIFWGESVKLFFFFFFFWGGGG